MKQPLFVIFLCWAITAQVVLSHESREIVFAYHEDFPPYAYMEGGKLVGICPEITNEAAALLGLKVIYKKLPWKRMLKDASSGKIDGVLALFKTRERMLFLYFPDNGLAITKNYLFTLKDSGINFSGDLHDLKDCTVGVVQDYSYGTDFDSAYFLQKEICSDDENLVEKFKKGRCRVGIGCPFVILHYARKFGIQDKIKFLKPAVVSATLYLTFSKARGKRHEELSKKFSDAIEVLKKNGTYQEILKKYNAEQEIIIGHFEAYPPYTVITGNGKLSGICPEIINEAAKILGIKVKFKKLPWHRIFNYAKIGKVDAIMPLFKNVERMQFLEYPDIGLVIEENFLFTLKNSGIKYNGNLHDLKSYLLGTVSGYSYGNTFDNYNFLKKDESHCDEILVKKLIRKRIKIGIGSREVIEFYARKLGVLDKIEFLEPPFVREPLYLAFSKRKGYEKLAKDFSTAVKELVRKGIYQEILKKYNFENKSVFRQLMNNSKGKYQQKAKNNNRLERRNT